WSATDGRTCGSGSARTRDPGATRGHDEARPDPAVGPDEDPLLHPPLQRQVRQPGPAQPPPDARRPPSVHRRPLMDTMIRQLNFRGDIRATMEPRVYDTYRGPMITAVVEYDEEAGVTR